MQPDKSRNGYICPICGSGSGKHGTGITTKDDIHFTCWRGCFKNSDIIDIHMKETGKDFNSALTELAGQIGITINGPQSDFKAKEVEKYPKEPRTPVEAKIALKKEELKDYTNYYLESCERCLTDQRALSYLQARGISPDTIASYLIGFDPEWISPTVREKKGNEWTPPATERIILPVSKNCYVARAIRSDVRNPKMNECGGGSIEIFNRRALKENQTVFVTEGIFDALSIIEAGGAAIALNSTANRKKFIELLEKEKSSATIILSLDNDAAGKEATEELKKSLARLNQKYLVADVCNGYKDANEALVKDYKAFEKAVQESIRKAVKPDNVSDYIEKFLLSDVEKLKEAADKKTGFGDLDKQSGGLYAGLYVIAATSSLGKTTFAGQIADNLAAAGHDVLFFSMEQSRLELVSKSLTRMIAKTGEKSPTSLALRKGAAMDDLKAAAAKYKQSIADRLSIIEGNFNCNVSYMGEYIRQYIHDNGCKPIVFIDYLQILQPEAADKNKRESVDHIVTELKRLSRENELTIFVISSVNRTNYLTPIDFESLKESGGIEYTADVIWGLQFSCLNQEIFSTAANTKIKEKREAIKKAKNENPRRIELVCLKNRYGIASFNSAFNFYPDKDLFEQSDGFFPCKEETPFTIPALEEEDVIRF